MNILVPALIVLAAAAKGNNIPALSDDLTLTSNVTTSASNCAIFHGRDACV